MTAVVLFACVIRLAVVAAAGSAIAVPTPDHHNFGAEMGWTARSLFLGQGFSSPFPAVTGPTALVPPIFPTILAGIFRCFGLYSVNAAFAILAFNSVCSALTCVAIYCLTRDALDVRIARMAAFAWAVYPPAIYFSACRVWDYALTTLLFTCCLAIAQKLHLRGALAWAGFGLLYGIGVHSNPCIATMFPIVLFIAAGKMRRTRRTWRKPLTHGLFAVVTFIATCAPWFMRNEAVLGKDFFVRDGFWLEFYAGNNGDTAASNSAFVHPASEPREMQRYSLLGETAYMAEKRAVAISFAGHHKLFVAEATLRRVVRFWTGFWSFSHEYLVLDPLDVPNVPFTSFLTLMMIVGLRRWWRENERAVLPYLLALLVFPLPYYLTHSSADYRQPLEPIVVILVVVGLFGTGAGQIEYEGDEPAAKERAQDATMSATAAMQLVAHEGHVSN